MAENLDLLEQRYCDIVASWRETLPHTRQDLTTALESYRVRFSYHSGKIENAAITYHDTRDVFENGKAVGFSGDVRTLFEIQNLKACHELMLDSFDARKPLTEELVLKFHETLTQGTYDEHRWAQGERPGEYKRHDYVVGIRDSGTPAGEVAAAVKQLLGELDRATPDNILTVAAYFHVVFEGIHPFADGNGRCGRALMNYLLIMHDHPPIIVFDEDKMAYYGAIEAWDTTDDLEPFKALLKAETVKTWTKTRG